MSSGDSGWFLSLSFLSFLLFSPLAPSLKWFYKFFVHSSDFVNCNHIFLSYDYRFLVYSSISNIFLYVFLGVLWKIITSTLRNSRDLQSHCRLDRTRISTNPLVRTKTDNLFNKTWSEKSHLSNFINYKTQSGQRIFGQISRLYSLWVMQNSRFI